MEVAMRKTSLLLLLITLFGNALLPADAKQGDLNLIGSTKAGVGYRVTVEEDFVYITNNDGVFIFDVHQSKRPRRIGRIHAGVTFGICVENGLAYISGENGLIIADVSDPANPKKISETAIDGKTHEVLHKGSTLYVTSSEGLEIFDVSDPDKVTLTGTVRNSGSRAVDVLDGIAYLACPGTGVEVIDVTIPASPRKVATVAGTKGAWDVHRHDDVLYVGCHAAGIKILSLRDSMRPQIIGSYNDEDGGEALGVWGDGMHLYIADNFGIEVLDVKDPVHPEEVAEYGKVRGAHDLVGDEHHIYVAESRKGLIIFER